MSGAKPTDVTKTSTRTVQASTAQRNRTNHTNGCGRAAGRDPAIGTATNLKEHRLKPLQEWICDTCSQVIGCPEDGWVEWLDDDTHLYYGFRIRHVCNRSTLHVAGPTHTGCQRYYRHLPAGGPGLNDLPLTMLVGPDGIAQMLSFIDQRVGSYVREPACRVRDLAEWTTLFRRLFLPYYEEARLYWDAAEHDGYFADHDPVSAYCPQVLQQLIEIYGPAGRPA